MQKHVKQIWGAEKRRKRQEKMPESRQGNWSRQLLKKESDFQWMPIVKFYWSPIYDWNGSSTNRIIIKNLNWTKLTFIKQICVFIICSASKAPVVLHPSFQILKLSKPRTVLLYYLKTLVFVILLGAFFSRCSNFT